MSFGDIMNIFSAFVNDPGNLDVVKIVREKKRKGTECKLTLVENILYSTRQGKVN